MWSCWRNAESSLTTSRWSPGDAHSQGYGFQLEKVISQQITWESCYRKYVKSVKAAERL